MKFKPSDISGGGTATSGSASLTTEPASAPMPKVVLELKRILVPVDFSKCSQKALEYAVPLARQFGATLILLHVIEPVVALPSTEFIPDTDDLTESTTSARQSLAQLQAMMSKDVATKLLVRTGSPQVEIIDVAKELGVDLVVLSTHGRTGLNHVLLGSTAEKVVRRIACPILIVREQEHEFIHVGNS